MSGRFTRRQGEGKALRDEAQAIQLDPKNGVAYNDCGFFYSKMGDKDKALADLNKAIQFKQDDTRIYLNRGAVLISDGDLDKALGDFDQALLLDPKCVAAYDDRFIVYSQRGDNEKALEDLAQIVLLDRNNDEAYNERAWILATCVKANLRDGKKAVADATTACQLSEWKNPEYLDTLAAAYAETGDFTNAVKWESKCLAPDNLPQNEIADARARLALYIAGKPYHADK